MTQRHMRLLCRSVKSGKIWRGRCLPASTRTPTRCAWSPTSSWNIPTTSPSRSRTWCRAGGRGRAPAPPWRSCATPWTSLKCRTSTRTTWWTRDTASRRRSPLTPIWTSWTSVKSPKPIQTFRGWWAPIANGNRLDCIFTAVVIVTWQRQRHK